MRTIDNLHLTIDKKPRGHKSHVKGHMLGYTILELIVVMALMLVIGGFIVGILNSTLRGNTKTKITSDIAQNGNYAMSIMTGIITNSQAFNSINTSLAFPNPVATCVGRVSNGKQITVTGFDGGVTTFTCNDVGTSPTYTISSNSASLLDTTQVKLIPGSCTFTCSQDSVYSAPRIDITFQLQNASGATYEKQANALFNTSISIRNYGQ